MCQQEALIVLGQEMLNSVVISLAHGMNVLMKVLLEMECFWITLSFRREGVGSMMNTTLLLLLMLRLKFRYGIRLIMDGREMSGQQMIKGIHKYPAIWVMLMLVTI